MAKTLLQCRWQMKGFQQSPTKLLNNPGSFYYWERGGVIFQGMLAFFLINFRYIYPSHHLLNGSYLISRQFPLLNVCCMTAVSLPSFHPPRKLLGQKPLKVGSTICRIRWNQAFSAQAGFSNWLHGWSDSKKDWCCDKEQKGCVKFHCEHKDVGTWSLGKKKLQKKQTHTHSPGKGGEDWGKKR